MVEVIGKTIGELPLNGGLTGASLIEVQDGAGISTKVSLTTLASWLLTATALTPANLPWRGARATLGTVLGITPPSNITWDSEDIDTDTIWSGAAPSRLTVPTGVTKIRLQARVEGQASTSTFNAGLVLYKNGVELQRFVAHRQASITGGTSQNVFSFVSGVLSVAAGDYFQLFCEGSFTSIAVGSFFQLEVVEYTS